MCDTKKSKLVLEKSETVNKFPKDNARILSQELTNVNRFW